MKATFLELKEKLTSAPLLTILRSGEKFVVYSDTSYQGLRCVLLDEERVITYGSRQLKSNEKNYLMHDLELVAIMFAHNI